MESGTGNWSNRRIHDFVRESQGILIRFEYTTKSSINLKMREKIEIHSPVAGCPSG